jgi:hypothetical protein
MAEATAAVAAADAMLAAAASGTTIHITPHDRSTRISESQPPLQSEPIT